MITRLATASDIDQILELQENNLYTNLPESERAANGFVTTPFTVETIQTLIAQTGVFIVEDQGHVGGYAFAGSWDFFSQWPIFPHMIARFPHLSPYEGIQITADNTFQYGPVCIDRNLRGTLAFPQLFKAMQLGMSDRFSLGVTFINQANPRSFVAHTKKLNLEVIDEFEFNGNSFYMLAFNCICSRENFLND